MAAMAGVVGRLAYTSGAPGIVSSLARRFPGLLLASAAAVRREVALAGRRYVPAAPLHSAHRRYPLVSSKILGSLPIGCYEAVLAEERVGGRGTSPGTLHEERTLCATALAPPTRSRRQAGDSGGS